MHCVAAISQKTLRTNQGVNQKVIRSWQGGTTPQVHLIFIKNMQKGWNQRQNLLHCTTTTTQQASSWCRVKKGLREQIFLLNDRPHLAVKAWLWRAHLSSAAVSKSRTRCILISIYKALSGFFISLAETGQLHSGRPSHGFYTSTCLVIGFHLLPYFLLWEIHCFCIKGISFHSVICLLA